MKTEVYDELNAKLRGFFRERLSFREIPAQAELSILSACEDPETISLCSIGGQSYPLPQTGQMRLETHLLRENIPNGVFCHTTSYRDEVKDERHDVVFPMFEFEGWGGIADLKTVLRELLEWLNFPKAVELNYADACKRYCVEMIDAEQERLIGRDYGDAVLLHSFPRNSHPFWNMNEVAAGTFNKVDAILYGVETIGSAERSCCPETMRVNFHSVSDGKYAKSLFNKFGRERVERELNEYLSLPFRPRFGAGIGMTRLIRAALEPTLIGELA